jgi:sodium-dependent dicarboxylate transporter 2/3/5
MDIKNLSHAIKKQLGPFTSWWRILAGPVAFILINLYFPHADFLDYPLLGNALSIAAWMIIWWILEPIPIYVTAFLPLILGSNMGLGTLPEISSEYGNDMVFLFLGGFMIARAIEKYDIHKNIAAKIVSRTGSSPHGVLLGFIIATAFLSMWLSNTGTTIMMLPMALTVLKPIPEGTFKNKYTLALLLSVAFSASIGGIATLIGSPPNVMMAGILENKFDIQVDFATWSLFGVPIAAILLFGMYIYFKKFLIKDEQDVAIQVEAVSIWTKNQRRVLLVFLCTVLFWTFKPLINKFTGIPLSDPQIALIATLLLFIIPKNNSKETLLLWNDTKETPWGILFLFGGGLALAKILNNGGVLDFFAELIEKSGFNNFYLLLLILVVSSIFLTELMSNLALVTVLVPIVAKIAESMNMDILALCLPITVAASCAFMLPMATPPNAIIFSSQQIKVKDMVRVGFILNLFSIAVIMGIVWIYDLIRHVF